MNWQDPEARKAYFRSYYRKRRKQQLALVSPVIACVICNATDNLHIDHIDPSKKCFHVNKRMLNRQELAKCQILCESCHNKKTSKEMTKPITHGTSYAIYRLRCKCTVCHVMRNFYRRQRAGTGIQNALKTHRPSGIEGSTPSAGTN